MQTIQEAVLRASLAAPELPLIHSTSLINFREVVAKNEIIATRCPVFDENLLYFFYGKPSYRVASRSGARTDLAYCPICFILKSSALKSVKRIFPFDSGAFKNGLYNQFIPKEATLDNFSLNTDKEIPARVVDLFFGTNRSYFLGEACPLSSIGTMDFEIQSYYQLISSTGESCVDDRKSSVEIQIDHNVSLTKDTVFAVVLPKASLQDPEVFDAINKTWQAIPITYNTFRGTAPAEYHGVIREQLNNFLENEGLL